MVRKASTILHTNRQLRKPTDLTGTKNRQLKKLSKRLQQSPQHSPIPNNQGMQESSPDDNHTHVNEPQDESHTQGVKKSLVGVIDDLVDLSEATAEDEMVKEFSTSTPETPTTQPESQLEATPTESRVEPMSAPSHSRAETEKSIGTPPNHTSGDTKEQSLRKLPQSKPKSTHLPGFSEIASLANQSLEIPVRSSVEEHAKQRLDCPNRCSTQVVLGPGFPARRDMQQQNRPSRPLVNTSHILASSIIRNLGPQLTGEEKNPFHIVSELKQMREVAWKNVSLDNMAVPVLDVNYYLSRRLPMRAAHLWAEHQHLMPFAEIASILSLPESFLRFWILKYAEV